MACNTLFGKIGAHALIAPAGPGIAGFLVGPDGIDHHLLLQRIQHPGDFVLPDQQWLAQLRKGLAQLPQGLADERPVSCRHVGLFPQARLRDIKRQYPAPFSGPAERRMIPDAQITLEPDELHTRPVHVSVSTCCP